MFWFEPAGTHCSALGLAKADAPLIDSNLLRGPMKGAKPNISVTQHRMP